MPAQRAYLTREQCDAVLDVMRTGDAAAMGLWVAFESRSFADFLSFLQPLQVIEGVVMGGGISMRKCDNMVLWGGVSLAIQGCDALCCSGWRARGWTPKSARRLRRRLRKKGDACCVHKLGARVVCAFEMLIVCKGWKNKG
jgi:hypothetical protein